MSVTLKGSREGIRVILDPEVDLPLLLKRLDELLHEHQAFLSGAQLIVDAGGRSLTPELVVPVLEQAQRYGLTVKAFLRQPLREPTARSSHRIFYGTVRSGQELRSEGDLVVVGDVNAGAKVVATGDVLVFGALRGIAHAGFPTDSRRLVCAREFAPPQVRVGKHVAANPSSEGGEGPELARVENDSIVVEPLNPSAFQRSKIPKSGTDGP